MSHLNNNKLSAVSRNWCCETMINLLKDFTHVLARIKSNKSIEDIEKKNKATHIHEIEYVTMEFNEACLAKNNRYVNLADTCVTLNNEKSSIRDKISKPMTCNLLVLNNQATNFCEEGFSNFSEMELFTHLLN